MPGEKSSILLLILGPLFIVLTIYSLVYVYYIQRPAIPSWIPTRRFNNLFSSPFVFARFDNTAGGQGTGEADSIAVEYNQELQYGTVASSFDNPLFKKDTDRRNEQKIESIGPNLNVDESGSGSFSGQLVEVELDSN